MQVAGRDSHDARRCDSFRGLSMPRYKAVYGPAKQYLPNSFMKSESNIMHGERRGIHAIQHDTNDTIRREARIHAIRLGLLHGCAPPKQPQGPLSSCYEQHGHGALLHLGTQSTTPIAQAMLGATAVECIPMSATVSNDGACHN